MMTLLLVWAVAVYWVAVDRHKALSAHEAVLLDREDRLTPDESWQLRNFGVIRKDFMGWWIDGVVERLLDKS